MSAEIEKQHSLLAEEQDVKQVAGAMARMMIDKLKWGVIM
jgi:hypothetical protein